MLDDTTAQVAGAALRPLRAAWDAAVHSRALRECRELTRLAVIAADVATLAEVVGRVAASVAKTDARRASALAAMVETSETLWPAADELRLMAEACQTVGQPEVAERLLLRGLTLADLELGARARLQYTLAGWHQQRGEIAAAERLLTATTDAFEQLGDVRSKSVAQGQIADILYRRGQLDEALRIRREEELPVYERLGDVREKAVTQGKIADVLYTRGQLDEALRIRREEELRSTSGWVTCGPGR